MNRKHAAETVEFLTWLPRIRKHLAAACGTESLIVRGPGAICETHPEGFATFISPQTIHEVTDKLLAESERVFVAFDNGGERLSAGFEMENVNAWLLQEFVARLADGNGFGAFASGVAAGLDFQPEPVRFVHRRVPFLVACVGGFADAA